MTKNLLILAVLVLLQVLGNIWLSRGMRQIGAIDSLDLAKLGETAIHVLTNPWVILGIIFQILALGLYLTAISRLDLSFVLPILASSYVLTTLFAWLILHEQVSLNRWVGSFLISLGVFLTSLTDPHKTRPQHP